MLARRSTCHGRERDRDLPVAARTEQTPAAGSNDRGTCHGRERDRDLPVAARTEQTPAAGSNDRGTSDGRESVFVASGPRPVG
jgi:hypothetical protein